VTTLELLLTTLVGVVIPIANGFLTRYGASKTRAVLQLVLNAANGFLVEWLAGGDAFNVNNALLLSATSLVVAIATELGVWRPLGVSEAAKSAGVGSSKS